jgi:hypothetical protein
VSLKFEDLPSELLAGCVLQQATVAVCPSLKAADIIAGALSAMKRGAVDPMIYTFAAGQYMVVLMGDVVKGITDGSEHNS